MLRSVSQSQYHEDSCHITTEGNTCCWRSHPSHSIMKIAVISQQKATPVVDVPILITVTWRSLSYHNRRQHLLLTFPSQSQYHEDCCHVTTEGNTYCWRSHPSHSNMKIAVISQQKATLVVDISIAVTVTWRPLSYHNSRPHLPLTIPFQ